MSTPTTTEQQTPSLPAVPATSSSNPLASVPFVAPIQGNINSGVPANLPFASPNTTSNQIPSTPQKQAPVPATNNNNSVNDTTAFLQEQMKRLQQENEQLRTESKKRTHDDPNNETNQIKAKVDQLQRNGVNYNNLKKALEDPNLPNETKQSLLPSFQEAERKLTKEQQTIIDYLANLYKTVGLDTDNDMVNMIKTSHLHPDASGTVLKTITVAHTANVLSLRKKDEEYQATKKQLMESEKLREEEKRKADEATRQWKEVEEKWKKEEEIRQWQSKISSPSSSDLSSAQQQNQNNNNNVNVQTSSSSSTSTFSSNNPLPDISHIKESFVSTNYAFNRGPDAFKTGKEKNFLDWVKASKTSSGIEKIVFDNSSYGQVIKRGLGANNNMVMQNDLF